MEYLTETKIDDNFLTEIISQLRQDKEASRSSEEQKIIAAIVRDLTQKQTNRSSTTSNFVLQNNEYNFLSQNEKSIWADYLIFRYKFKIYPVLKQLTSFPVHILVEPVSYCNLRCSKCFQTDATFTRKPYMGYMDIGLFKNIVDEAVEEGNRALTMASRGEPTLHPKFGEILQYARNKFFDLKINTNAMLLNEEKCHQILQNEVTELVFSVDTTEKNEYERVCKNGNFYQIMNNIIQFHEIRRRQYPKSKCKTRVSGVKYKPDFDTKHFLEFWKEFVDDVFCVDLVNYRWDSYNNKPSTDNYLCPLLWQRVYIWFDGIVNPCDYDYKSLLKVGNVRENSIKEIWLGEQFGKLREGHLKGMRQSYIPCDRCERREC